MSRDTPPMDRRTLLRRTGTGAHHGRQGAFAGIQRRRSCSRNYAQELMIILNAGHINLSDRVDLIPFDRLGRFFAEHLAMGRPVLRSARIAAGMLVAISASVGATPAQEGSRMMEIMRKTDLNTVQGPAEYFTGKVTITGQFQRPAPSRVSGAIVRFEPGARTAWHTHPAGQLLIITSGKGWVQEVGGPKREVKTGDVIWIPAGIKHWHGATATTGMSHFAIQNSIDGKNVDWMEKVTDEDYAR
jgi:quercetin dioxygenase-like cupin family protein